MVMEWRMEWDIYNSVRLRELQRPISQLRHFVRCFSKCGVADICAVYDVCRERFVPLLSGQSSEL